MSMQRIIANDCVTGPSIEPNDCLITQFDANSTPFIMSGMWEEQQQAASPVLSAISLHANEGWIHGYSNFQQSCNQCTQEFLDQNLANYQQHYQKHQEFRAQQVNHLQEMPLGQQKFKQPRRARELNAMSGSFDFNKNSCQFLGQLIPAVGNITEDQQLSGRSTPTRNEHQAGPTSPVTEIAIRIEGILGTAPVSPLVHEPKIVSTSLSASAPAFVPAFSASFSNNNEVGQSAAAAVTPTRRKFSSHQFITPTHKSQHHSSITSQDEAELQDYREHQSPALKTLHNQFMEEYVTRSPHADPAAPWLTYECDSVRQAMQQFIGAEGEIPEAHLSENAGKQSEALFQPAKSKEIFKKMRALERQGLRAVQQFCNDSLHSIPGLEIKMMGEVADFAKRIGCVEEARDMFARMRNLQPSSQHAWLESAKMEEELGCVEQCEELLLQGLVQCPQSDSILLKAVKLQEKLGNMRMARSLLSRMKLIPVERAWRVILEGALLETRAGNVPVARKVFKYLIKSVPWYGPIYCDMCAVHERECDWLRAEKIVACGLTNIPRYGPLWLCAMRVCERKFMLPANSKPLYNAAHLVCDHARKIATQALQLMGSKELVWKLLMQASQSEARAGNLSNWRSAISSAALSAPDNLRWKVWNAAAKMELVCGDANLCLPLLDRALQECSAKTRSVVLLDKAKCLEIQGQTDAARASLVEADRDSKDWRFEFDRIMFEARQGATHEMLQERVERAVEIYPASGRLWALCVQLQKNDAEKVRQFKRALSSVPKSGELWCEGARMLLQPQSKLYNPALAMERLVMAANFTPQYGDTFIEMLKCECLLAGSFANFFKIELAAKNADPNYGVCWFWCKESALDTTASVMARARERVVNSLHLHRAVYTKAHMDKLTAGAKRLRKDQEGAEDIWDVSLDAAKMLGTALPDAHAIMHKCSEMTREQRIQLVFGPDDVGV